MTALLKPLSESPASSFDASLLGGRNPALTDQERAGVAIADARPRFVELWPSKLLLMSMPSHMFSHEFAC